MARPLVLIHGYSAEGKDFENLKQALVSRGIDSKDIDICNYISLNNEITIKDIAEGLDRAFRMHAVFGNETQEFDAIVHSTGMLVLRAWLANAGAPATNARLKRLKQKSTRLTSIHYHAPDAVCSRGPGVTPPQRQLLRRPPTRDPSPNSTGPSIPSP